MTPLGAQRKWSLDRAGSAVLAVMVSGSIGYALIAGLRGASLPPALTDPTPLALFDLPPPAEERRESVRPVQKPAAKREAGARPAPAPRLQEKPAAAAALPIPPAPAPAIMPVPISTVAAPSAGGGGSAGTGGEGSGSGSGGAGTGGGGEGGDGGAFSRARQIGGRFRNSDFPPAAREAGRVKIGVRYAIGPSGHVDKCDIIESSGYAEVDAMTCRVIEERYRFRPARDPDGYAVTEVREEDYRWRVH